MTSSQGHLDGVIQQVQQLLQTRVTANVTLTTTSIPAPALPAVLLYLPALKRQRTEADNQPDQAVADGQITLWKPPHYYDLQFRYELAAADLTTLTTLAESMVGVFVSTDAITVSRSLHTGGTELVDYPLLEQQEPAPGAGQGSDFRMTGQFAVRGVAIQTDVSTTGPVPSVLNITVTRKEGE